jgi:hypothetical protein
MTANRISIDLGAVTNTCFVVMPFHALYEAEYDRVIRPAIQALGLTCVRGDEIYGHQAIIHDIWQSIRRARLVVAELSERNPNVMYEIGLAHALGKPIVLLTRNEDDVPFDLKALRYLYYDINNPDWGENLRSELSKKVQNILEDANLSAHLGGIEVSVALPPRPALQAPVAEVQKSIPGIAGVWQTSWLSILRTRQHDATLVILPEHGSEFVATMTVSFLREGVRTIVQETLTGTLRGDEILLTGVSYTFVEQGTAPSYSLDSFELAVSADAQSMSGRVVVKHGTRPVKFDRLAEASTRRP